MIYTVTITSQGQISIPAKLRRKLGLDKTKKATIFEKNGNLVIEPAKDFLELGGSLHKSAKKNMSIDEIIKMEKEAVGNAIAERYRKNLKKIGIKILK